MQGGDFRSQEEQPAPEWGEGGMTFSLETWILWVREKRRVRVHWDGEAGRQAEGGDRQRGIESGQGWGSERRADWGSEEAKTPSGPRVPSHSAARFTSFEKASCSGA